MPRSFYILLVAQFLTAFGDNAIMFAGIAIVMQAGDLPGWYIPAMQACFLLPYVALAPWLGALADHFRKTLILGGGNGIKALGTLLLIVGVNPLVAYAIVGAGAATYSPGKYGILPELVTDDRLVKANGWIESSTILAILTGSLAGAMVADHSIPAALIMIVAIYAVSALMPVAIRIVRPGFHRMRQPLYRFAEVTGELARNQRARFAILGTTLFWCGGAVMRVLLVAWAPIVLAAETTTDIAELMVHLAAGVAVGALVAPRLVPLTSIQRATVAGVAMGCIMLAFAASGDIWTARILLVVVGFFGALFIVPLNAVVQDEGYRHTGSGSAIAVQRFVENAGMLVATGLYTALSAWGVSPILTMYGLALVVCAAVVLLYLMVRRRSELAQRT